MLSPCTYWPHFMCVFTVTQTNASCWTGLTSTTDSVTCEHNLDSLHMCWDRQDHCTVIVFCLVGRTTKACFLLVKLLNQLLNFMCFPCILVHVFASLWANIIYPMLLYIFAYISVLYLIIVQMKHHPKIAINGHFNQPLNFYTLLYVHSIHYIKKSETILKVFIIIIILRK